MSDKKKIVLLATGGTIAGAAADSADSWSYKPGTLPIDEILKAVPQLKDLVQIKAITVSSIGSEDMTNDVWIALAKAIEDSLADDKCVGAVVTHGTDTLEETAFFLNLTLKTNKPVVLTGAMRPATALSPDGPANLLAAVKTAIHPDSAGKGVLVVMGDQIHGARDVTKTNTSSTMAFDSPIFGVLGLIAGGKVRFYKESVRQHTVDTPFLASDLASAPRVDIIYAHADQDGVLIEASIKAGAKGIVYAGFGNGSLHKNTVDALYRAIKEGVIVVRTTRTGSGVVVDADPAWTKMGILSGSDFNPQKARILLQLALTETTVPELVQEYFDQM